MTKFFVAKIPTEIKKLLQALKIELPKILGQDLFGIYVYGSLTYNAFNPATSDVDVVAVLNRDLSQRQLSKLRQFHKLVKAYGNRGDELEIDYVNRRKFFKPAFVYELHGNKLKKVKYCDAFKPITWLNIRNSGITFFGPRPKTWVPVVAKSHLDKALKEEIEYLCREMISKRSRPMLWEQVYWVLTLCRVIFTKRKGTLPSKEQAGKWALKYLNKQWRDIITLALKYRSVYTRRKGIKIFDRKIPLFIKYVEKLTK